MKKLLEPHSLSHSALIFRYRSRRQMFTCWWDRRVTQNLPQSTTSGPSGKRSGDKTSTLMNVRNQIIFIKLFASTPNSFLLFTNLSGVNGHGNSSRTLISSHASVLWPIETCREISLIQKAAAIYQDIHFT